MNEDLYAIYCPKREGYHIGPITIQECAEVLGNIAIWGTCGTVHTIELIEVTNDPDKPNGLDTWDF